MSDREFVLTLSCPDSRGIVAAVANLLAAHQCNIEESQQFGDHYTGRFFMRVQFTAESPQVDEDALRGALAALASEYAMDWDLWRRDVRMRVLVMVSKYGHCLNDLLYRQRSGTLKADIAAVVSNHPDLEFLAKSYGVDFHHLPVTPQTKPEQEARVLELIQSYQIDLVVLARYMQVLSEDLCQKLAGRIINIHHSFLPSFKGARPYHQAHARGVKLIGATAHYVTADLDEGPIIEQEVARVDHTFSPEQLTEVGRDLESMALARAVNWHAEHRILLNGSKTVVFR
ncbi:formyltetrahydrofolate deformylase [Thermobifida fusca]|jgi:formyltetrahydrofolate deformylase|uniref:Formyltetrahydrofolate deformylase n=2 Tax=Thermobifida fusca TaxID=2021 RepID=A0A9P2WQ21_THEFU|nr:MULTISPECIES: formyltetrahydrofolate deformylase [Thermobifida]AAZ56389.1 formyltetrahydrofolate deformylase [Thermobifida fusca YX]EOR70564.1 formyltetrahydrofolate deformylase [Thermobifida fusca TM51]MBO2531138.1 formyltetrahydrofolate deformylase [Thermobifida sp.]MDD6791461.1 formyltetrahydrofolate deformylase [Thermobifida fusca]PPS91516.1 formyltetrahydrofolate deformylase [Thermobifida fusca]